MVHSRWHNDGFACFALVTVDRLEAKTVPRQSRERERESEMKKSAKVQDTARILSLLRSNVSRGTK